MLVLLYRSTSVLVGSIPRTCSLHHITLSGDVRTALLIVFLPHGPVLTVRRESWVVDPPGMIAGTWNTGTIQKMHPNISMLVGVLGITAVDLIDHVLLQHSTRQYTAASALLLLSASTVH